MSRKNITLEGRKGSVATDAGLLLMRRSMVIISNAKNKRQLPDGRFSIPAYEFFRLHGILMRFPKNETKILLNCLILSGFIECSPQRTEIIFREVST